MTEITLNDLTSPAGEGAFDKLLAAVVGHVDVEYTKGRITGPEYSTVYLGSIQNTLTTATQFLLSKDKAALEAQILQVQLEIAEIEKGKMEAEKALTEAGVTKITAEISLLEAKELESVSERARIDQQTALLVVDTANAVLTGAVLEGQACKLKAEFDVLEQEVIKKGSEIGLLNQKKVTETAQTASGIADADSVVGKQNALYTAQTQGFARDAEQKAAKIFTDIWSVQRSTDEGITASSDNGLDDPNTLRVVNALLSGINA